jgi:hypothetical protein
MEAHSLSLPVFPVFHGGIAVAELKSGRHVVGRRD